VAPVFPAAATGAGGASDGLGRRPAPALAEGTELLGEYHGSGRVEAPYLIRRADGRMVEVSPLLHLVARMLDGRRRLGEVAADVSSQLGRPLTAEDVAYLVDSKLAPLGVVAQGATPPVAAPAADPLLGLSLRIGVIPAQAVRRVATALRPVFMPAVVAGVVVALVVLDSWLVAARGIGDLIPTLLSQPSQLLVVVGLTLLAGAFHELGHATATRYGGADPGVIGAGIYLLWPVFYNDLDDSYRLSRAGRLRADLGGVYFNVIFILVLFGAYGLTGAEPVLVAIVVQHLAVLQQFLPFVRLDGYYIVSDLAGVPDLFGRIRPVLSSMVPGRTPTAAVTALRPKARIVVTTWVLLTVPLLVGVVGLFVAGLPAMASAGWKSLALHAAEVDAAVTAGAPLRAVLSGLQLVFLVVPAIGLSVPVLRGVRRLTRSSTAGLHRRPVQGSPLAERREQRPPVSESPVEGGGDAAADTLALVAGLELVLADVAAGLASGTPARPPGGR